ncbi:amidohydrolase [Actinoplanes italicus]|uniref:Hippurate hydrolase n=1 Tax=Actinoplanes italicus TaxID=113567 RepID=A0A2T0KHT4_9ACTN|nr:amidohydrolase [Actinoplanes italicus]PRX23003.1 hippurate hydrolase [Actinoplanes italicus]GIE28524.1 amidohydrolase [Actinoplanes italicus]
MSITDLAGLDARLRGWRHHLHRIPEMAFAEHETSHFVAGALHDLGFQVVTGVGGTGVVASLTRGRSGRAIGLRSELDGLPIDERSGVAYTSEHPGAMHACGHDGHMAMVLGAAAVLAGEGFDGTVRIILQPAEEPGRGAQAMVNDGLFERFPVDRLFGLHNHPGSPAGHLLTRSGPLMASEDNFTIHITGRGGHASAPHLVVDPLVIGAEILLALQQVVARSVDPIHSAVLSCTDLRTDGARNAIPSHVTITGDTRSFDPSVQALLERRIREISAGIAAAHGATAEITYTHEFAPTLNDDECVAIAGEAAARALGQANVELDADPIMASEDFGVLASHVPACLALIGNGVDPGKGGTPLHSHDYTFNDGILTAGVAYYREVAIGGLRTGKRGGN